SKSHVLVSAFAESNSRRDRNLRFLEEEFRKLQRPYVTIGQGNACPHKHRGQRFRDLPADPIQPAHQHISTFLVTLDGFLDTVRRTVQCDHTRDLKRLENTIVEVAFDLRERSDDLSITDTKPHSPARHVVGLGQCVELYPAVFGSR